MIMMIMINILFEEHFPTRTIRVRVSDPPWVKASLKILIDDRDRSFRDGRWAKYRRLRSEIIDHALRHQFLTSASSSKNSKLLWQWRSVARCSRKSSRSRFSAEEINSFSLPISRWALHVSLPSPVIRQIGRCSSVFHIVS